MGNQLCSGVQFRSTEKNQEPDSDKVTHSSNTTHVLWNCVNFNWDATEAIRKISLTHPPAKIFSILKDIKNLGFCKMLKSTADYLTSIN